MKQKILNKIKDYVIANYQKIDQSYMVLGELPYNRKCHLNAVQKVKERKAKKVFACIAINKFNNNDIIVHFINQLQNKKYQDNTWGWLYREYDYYLVKEVSEEEQENIGRYFTSLRDFLIKNNSSKIERMLAHVDIENFI